MALLQLMSEETIGEEHADQYFDGLYQVVCVGERPLRPSGEGDVVRSTYIVDWEQLVHVLEDHGLFGEDIVEVRALSADDARLVRGSLRSGTVLARA